VENGEGLLLLELALEVLDVALPLVLVLLLILLLVMGPVVLLLLFQRRLKVLSCRCSSTGKDGRKITPCPRADPAATAKATTTAPPTPFCLSRAPLSASVVLLYRGVTSWYLSSPA